jgi:thiamine-monophosphate kinase
MMPSNIDKVSDLGEKNLIKRLLSKSQNPGINSLFLDELSIKSFSDDAALIDIGKNYLVTCSDMLMAYTHFPNEMSPYQIGQKVVAVNVSDLAAMGAEAIGILISMGLPRNMKLSEFDQIIDGILNACKKYNMSLIGGDTNEAKELTLCGTCLGIVKKEDVLMRHGARPGDILAVTGPLGLAAAGFKVLIDASHKFDNLNTDTRDMVIKHALQPEAKLDIGIILANSGSVTSATDITDGLLSELGEMINACEEGIGIANISEDDPLEMALAYGEDFELVFSVKPDLFLDLKSKINLYKIGSIDSSGMIKMVDKEGNTNILTPKGYDHLK